MRQVQTCIDRWCCWRRGQSFYSRSLVWIQYIRVSWQSIHSRFQLSLWTERAKSRRWRWIKSRQWKSRVRQCGWVWKCVWIRSCGCGKVGIYLWIRRNTVWPRDSHTLAFVLHSSVLKPYLKNIERKRGVRKLYWKNYIPCIISIQSTLVISNSKGRFETLRDIRTSTYQGCGTEENN